MMKAFEMRAFICSISVIGLGCAVFPGPLEMARAAEPTSRSDEAVMQLSASDTGRTIRVKVRQQMAVLLEANPTTGYSWAVLSAQNVQVDQPIEVVNPSAAPSLMVGTGGIAIVKVRPIRAGRGFLVLGYKRPWEKAAGNIVRYSFRITR